MFIRKSKGSKNLVGTKNWIASVSSPIPAPSPRTLKNLPLEKESASKPP